MINNINERLVKLITELNISKNQFASEIGTSSAMISKITKNRVNFGIDLLEKIISAYPSLNQQWLLTGIGEMWTGTHGYNPSPTPSISPRANQNSKNRVMGLSDGLYNGLDLKEDPVLYQKHLPGEFLSKKSQGLERRIKKQLDLKITQSSNDISQLAFLIQRLNDFAFVLDDLKSYYFDNPEKTATNLEKHYNGIVFDYDSYGSEVIAEYEKLLKFKPSLENLIKAIFIFYKDIESLDEHDIAATLYGISERSKLNTDLKRE